MLQTSRLCASYRAIQAVRDVSIEVPDGSLVAVLGANGAGKSTLVRSIAGVHRQKTGTVLLDGTPIQSMPLHKITRLGVALVPEGRHVVAPLTVAENLALSSYAGRSDQALEDRVYDLFPRLAERRDQAAGLMSGGEQQMLAMGRALMTRPRVLLLDEPSMGLAPSIISVIYEAIAALHAEGQSILLIEQDATRALAVADHAYLLQRGEVRMAGTPAELAQSDDIKKAYLG
ncbi:branched-chain amino acid transport system ATP-binding protein [Nocardioides marinisabuli]|uniref:Branched-chain amino acid transport system ATP-binding protein n=1 Tax=Nocardioides marinisabuli TaxID=419476 RepID=A0A7Y9JSF3_9ACTN|nr:ABC transporter ATP-binding protein [Nocardioides marinisabuli]NYD59530.1 branched-chain amino acid transport system ATP-binding protein [Nocardioides marinisabuli]